MYKQCPECSNENILEVHGEEIEVIYSVKTGKCLKRSKHGKTTFFMYTCKCGWKSEEFTE